MRWTEMMLFLAALRAIIKNMLHVRAQFFSSKLFNYYEPKHKMRVNNSLYMCTQSPNPHHNGKPPTCLKFSPFSFLTCLYEWRKHLSIIVCWWIPKKKPTCVKREREDKLEVKKCWRHLSSVGIWSQNKRIFVLSFVRFLMHRLILCRIF